MHGGWGYLTDFEVERLWRDVRLGEIGAGTNEIRQLLSLCNHPRRSFLL